ncbi:hypothetical protein BDQ17DRAFT_369538 [Cyathus striatus]|nr:hypothetical protein BDQ17DRAFT_369538 [Cyathus striatus]
MAILKIIALIEVNSWVLGHFYYIAVFLGIKQSDLKLQMLHLHSIIYILTKDQYFGLDHGVDPIRFHHAFVEDFLLDPSRSGKIFIDPVKGSISLAQHCQAITLHIQSDDSHPAQMAWDIYNIIPVQNYAVYNYFLHMKNFVDSEEANISAIEGIIYAKDMSTNYIPNMSCWVGAIMESSL